jgi:hypothetical protein
MIGADRREALCRNGLAEGEGFEPPRQLPA